MLGASQSGAPVGLAVVTTFPAAVLWDMDGTLVDTEPYWMGAETTLVESFGGTWSHDDGLSLVGGALLESATILRARGVDLGDQEIVDYLTNRVLAQVQQQMTWRPGAETLLRELRQLGIPTALVTSSPRALAEGIAGGISFDAFDHIVAGDDVALCKPHPEPYLRAAELIGVAAADCVAIEDSTPGLASAVASGAVTIGVPLHSVLSETLGYSIWPTLEGRSVSDLGDLFRCQRPLHPKDLV